jgi:hypothetical protein
MLIGKKNIHVLLREKAVIGGEITIAPDGDIKDSIEAISNVEFCLLPNSLLVDSIERNTYLLREIVAAASFNIRAYCEYTWMLQGTRVSERVMRFFSLCNISAANHSGTKLHIPISHDSLAVIIHDERGYISRFLEKLRGLGLIELGHRLIVVKESFWTAPIYTSECSWDAEQLGSHRLV